MKGYVDNIEKVTVANEDFRRVLYTGANLQLLLMTLKPGEEHGQPRWRYSLMNWGHDPLK